MAVGINRLFCLYSLFLGCLKASRACRLLLMLNLGQNAAIPSILLYTADHHAYAVYAAESSSCLQGCGFFSDGFCAVWSQVQIFAHFFWPVGVRLLEKVLQAETLNVLLKIG